MSITQKPQTKLWLEFTCEVTGGSTLVSTSSVTSTGAAGAVGSDGSGGTTGMASSVPPGGNQLLEGFREYLHLYICTIVIQLYIIYIHEFKGGYGLCNSGMPWRAMTWFKFASLYNLKLRIVEASRWLIWSPIKASSVRNTTGRTWILALDTLTWCKNFFT